MKYNLSLLNKLASDDEHFIIDMLLTFKNTAPPIIEKMREYQMEDKYEAIGREAHKLIPGVSFLGANELKDELIKIEEGVKENVEKEQIDQYVVHTEQLVNELIGLFEQDFNLNKYE